MYIYICIYICIYIYIIYNVCFAFVNHYENSRAFMGESEGE